MGRHEGSGRRRVPHRPQKGWPSPACAGIVLLVPRAYKALLEKSSDSFSLNLRNCLDVTGAHLSGGFAYHTTMPTDCLQIFRDTIFETRKYGSKKAKKDFLSLGKATREMLECKGFRSVSRGSWTRRRTFSRLTSGSSALLKSRTMSGLHGPLSRPWTWHCPSLWMMRRTTWVRTLSCKSEGDGGLLAILEYETPIHIHQITFF